MGVLLSLAASLMLSYGGAIGADVLLERGSSSDAAQAEQIIDASQEGPSISELNEGISPM